MNGSELSVLVAEMAAETQNQTSFVGLFSVSPLALGTKSESLVPIPERAPNPLARDKRGSRSKWCWLGRHCCHRH
jgi:hypothetical protein